MKLFCLVLPSVLASFAIYAIAAPTPLRMKNEWFGSTTVEKEFLGKVEIKVNEILGHMKKVVEEKNQDILGSILGDDHTKDEYVSTLLRNINTLQQGTVVIFYSGEKPPNVPGDKNHVTAIYDTLQDYVMLFEPFYSNDLKVQSAASITKAALIFIHESAHALLKCADDFKKDGHFTQIKGYATEDHYSGYIYKDFKTLRTHGGARVMLQNADTYALLGHLAANGNTNWPNYATRELKPEDWSYDRRVPSSSGAGGKRQASKSPPGNPRKKPGLT